MIGELVASGPGREFALVAAAPAATAAPLAATAPNVADAVEVLVEDAELAPL